MNNPLTLQALRDFLRINFGWDINGWEGWAKELEDERDDR